MTTSKEHAEMSDQDKEALLKEFPHAHLQSPSGLPRRICSRLNEDGTEFFYSPEGPANIGDPVHEMITERALRAAGLIGPHTLYTDGDAWDYTRGVFWNDDPECLLFDDSELPANYSIPGGLRFISAFNEAKRNAKSGAVFGVGSRLLARSHFGDLQFLHSMATTDGEQAEQTKIWVLEWAEFCYRVAVQQEPWNRRLCDVNLPQIRRWFPGDETIVMQLFGIRERGDASQRALGSLMHMIQDSYCAGHTQRHPQDRTVVEFHSYTHQDCDKHKKADALIGGSIDKTPGAPEAVMACKSLLDAYRRDEPWSYVQGFLRDSIFELFDLPHPSSPGAQFKE